MLCGPADGNESGAKPGARHLFTSLFVHRLTQRNIKTISRCESPQGSFRVTHSSQQALRLLDGAVTAEEADHHHHRADRNQNVDT